MTVAEAAALVLKADTLARAGDTFWLDMGEPVRIGTLVNRLLALAARRGYPAVPIEIVGLRPGEKRAEQLTTQGLEMRKTTHPRIWAARQVHVPRRAIDAAVQTLARHVTEGDSWRALTALAAIVPDYEPSAEAWTAARSECLYRQIPDPASAGRLSA
jgi:FlaA1/EpsC-like NDP-sugar epimerase